MTRLLAVVIGGGSVAGALALSACASTVETASVRVATEAQSAETDVDVALTPDADEADAATPDADEADAATDPTPTAAAARPELWAVDQGPDAPSVKKHWSGGLRQSAALPLARQIVDLPAAPIGPVASLDVRQPIGLRIPSLGIDEAVVVDVGVETNGDFEVPIASEVGWYRFGPTPGAEGSAVLAAHIAQGGVDGVFRYLADLEVGAEFSVIYDDGTAGDFRVTEMNQYDKDELPTDELFRKFGDSQLVLITCGGDFNRQIRSYDDNVVAVAVPI